METLYKTNMEKLIQLLQSVHEEMSASAWTALGVLLPIGIMLCLIALRWIRYGGLSNRSARDFFAQQRQIARWLEEG